MKLKLLSLFIISISICQAQTTKKITADNRFSIEIPSSLTETEGLNDLAFLQYQNIENDYYFIAIAMKVEDFEFFYDEYEMEGIYERNFDGFCQYFFDDLLATLFNATPGEWQKFNVDNTTAKKIEIDALLDYELEAFYNVNFIKGKKEYFYLVFWTLPAQKNTYNALIKKAINSIKLL